MGYWCSGEIRVVRGIAIILMLSHISAEPRAQSVEENALTWAVEHREGGVYEVVIQRLWPKVLYKLRMYEVELVEAHKPYIDGEGWRRFPLRLYEWLESRDAPLKVGKRYLIVTALQRCHRGINIVIKSAIELTSETMHLRAKLCEAVKTKSVVGSFENLEAWDRGDLLLEGIRSKNPSGLMDVAIYGFGENSLTEALQAGHSVVLARQESHGTKRLDKHWVRVYRFAVIEHLAGPPQGKDGLLELIGPVAITPPGGGYPSHVQTDGRTYLLVVKRPTADSPGRIKAHLPVLRANGPNVMAVKKTLVKIQEKR